MLKDSYQLCKFLFTLYWGRIIVFTSVYGAALYLRAQQTQVPGISRRVMVRATHEIIFVALVIAVISFGRLFSQADRAAWLHKLPFRNSVLNVFPLSVICIMVLAQACLGPALSSAAAPDFVYTIGNSVSLFLIMKNTRHSMSYGWSFNKSFLLLLIPFLFPPLAAFSFAKELGETSLWIEKGGLVLLVYVVIWQLLARKERKFTWPTVIIAFGIFMSLYART